MRRWFVFGVWRTLCIFVRLLPILALRFLNNPRQTIRMLRGKNASPS